MPNILDGIGVVMDFLVEHGADCPFCKDDKPLDPSKFKSNSDPNWEGDATGAIGNDSGQLESSMKSEGNPRPTGWQINIPVTHAVVPNPHHLIPGNESLKQSKILDWIFEGPKITGDIGYDVNNARNGVWLPSNNAMRGNAKWADPTFKVQYVVAAMDKSRGHFHDRHGDPYSSFVTKLLNKISDRMNGIEAQNPACPYKTKAASGGKFSPPYSLVQRLNGVSQRIAPCLRAKASPTQFLYTSKLVYSYWKVKGMVH